MKPKDQNRQSSNSSKEMDVGKRPEKTRRYSARRSSPGVNKSQHMYVFEFQFIQNKVFQCSQPQSG